MILPPATLGILGGGQLGRFFVIAAHEMGYKVVVLDPDPHSPAGRIADVHLAAAYNDADALNRMAETCAAVTTEFENVPAETLAYLSKFVPVHPDASAVAVAQNRIAEKNFLKEHGIPHAPYGVIRKDQDLTELPAALFPGILKVARFGYDGKGQVRVADVQEAQAAFQHLKGEPCVLEKMMSLDYEVSVVLARGEDGQIAAFPAAENSHRHGILDVSIVPARCDPTLGNAAVALAQRVAAELEYVGVLGVEFFVSEGKLLVNEMAPRPHNSGHYTLDACVTNQFEQQVRALCGLPLGDPRAHSAAVMVNLLGNIWLTQGHQAEPAWQDLFCEPGLKQHLYGKHHARPGRKMGHFTVIDGDPARALDRALAARRRIGVEDSL